MDRRHRESQRRCCGDDGTALVEMALLIVPLSLILFGIIVYGYLMSFRQNMTAAAAEGARAGAVAVPDTNYVTAKSRALDATNRSLQSFGQQCTDFGGTVTCGIEVDNAFTGPACTNSPVPCIKVTVSYPYHDHPLLPDIPIVSQFLPNTFVSSNSAQLNT